MAHCAVGDWAARLRGEFAMRRRKVAHAVAAILIAAWLIPAFRVLIAAEPASKASTSRIARDDATRSIPFDKLSADARGKITGVVTMPACFVACRSRRSIVNPICSNTWRIIPTCS